MNKICAAARLHAVLAGACVVGLILGASPALAQGYPDRTVRIIVPFAAGGGSDVVARAVAQSLSDKLKQPVVVENRTGAGGSLGATVVARAPADGYTLLMGSNSEISQYPNVKADIPYDSLKDFAPIMLVANVPFVLAVTDKLPVKTVAELLDYARKNPGKLNYGSGGVGSATHLAMALLTSMTGTTMTHVPYKGSVPVVTDLLAGNLDFAIPTLAAALPHANGGKLRIIAASTPKRALALPNIPTIAESGVVGYATGLWAGLLAPTGTPTQIVAQLNAAIVEALASPEFQQTLARQGAEPVGGTPEDFAQEIRREMGVWKDVVQKTGIRVE
jgi:tripartite-type tricarboxylate transporter receptor subunit TctC